MRYIAILLVTTMFFGKLKSQDLPFVLQFDKPIYTTGETAWFAVIRTDSAQFLDVQEVLHFELVSPRNIKVITGKISFAERIAEGR